MRADEATLWSQLRGAGLVDGELPASSGAQTPWFIRVMSGIAGWVAACFLLGFVVTAFPSVIKSSGVSLSAGILLCVAAVFIFRLKEDLDFPGQFGLALSIAGQMLILFGLSMDNHSQQALISVSLQMAAVEILLFLLITNFLHRVWCATAALFAVTFLMNDLGWHYLSPAILLGLCALVWMNEFAWPQRGGIIRALGYASVFVSLLLLFRIPLFGGLGIGIPRSGDTALAGYQQALGILLTGAVFLAVVVRLLAREGISVVDKAGLVTLATAAVVAVASIWAPGLPVILVAMLVGFAHGNRILVGLGVFSMLAYLSQYYYWLDITLLRKSTLLIVTGTVLLALRLGLKSLWPGGHGHAQEDANA